MELKQILTVVSAHGDHAAAFAIAAALAERDGAEVEGVCLFREPEPAVYAGFAAGAAGVADVLQQRDEDVLRLTAPAERGFRTLWGPAARFRATELLDWSAVVAGRAVMADLVVVGAAGHDGEMRGVAERLVFGAGAPCLIAPIGLAGTFDPRRIAIAWNGSREARRAVGDALGLIRRASSVAIVAVGEEDPPGATALASLLARHGVEPEVRRVPPQHDAARAILAEADAFGADLVVMGAFSRSRAEERILGGATRTLIGGASLPILMSH
jgi:nucleotide-binding universal stress UspA family protein